MEFLIFLLHLFNGQAEPIVYLKKHLNEEIAAKTIDSRSEETRIDSITKTITKNGTVSLYIIFSNPTVAKEKNLFRIKVRLSSTDPRWFEDQEIDETYSYKPDSGSFIYNDIKPRKEKIKEYSVKFIIHDLFSNKKAEKTITLKF